jgi:hypothetical protein
MAIAREKCYSKNPCYQYGNAGNKIISKGRSIMASEVESRVVDGEEQHAIWVPITAAEGEALVKKAKAENVNIRYLIANMLRAWMKSGELSAADLEGVVGGTGSLQPIGTLNLANISLSSQIIPAKLTLPNATESTVMCAW